MNDLDTEDAKETLNLLGNDLYNFSRPADYILQDFGNVLLYLDSCLHKPKKTNYSAYDLGAVAKAARKRK